MVTPTLLCSTDSTSILGTPTPGGHQAAGAAETQVNYTAPPWPQLRLQPGRSWQTLAPVSQTGSRTPLPTGCVAPACVKPRGRASAEFFQAFEFRPIAGVAGRCTARRRTPFQRPTPAALSVPPQLPGTPAERPGRARGPNDEDPQRPPPFEGSGRPSAAPPRGRAEARPRGASLRGRCPRPGRGQRPRLPARPSS